MVEATSGLLVLDKPCGLSSHSAVSRVRRALGVTKAGHAGTLDPLASGVLLIAVGYATRLLEFLTLHDKVYEATVRLGLLTDTLDREGEVQCSKPVPDLRGPQIDTALGSFLGPISQVPPAFSAIKVGGQPLYRRARRGETVEPPPRTVTIHSLRATDWEPPDLHLRVECSSGTYIRSLARDLGAALGTLGSLWKLRRTRSGPYTIEQSVPLDRVLAEPGAARARLLRVEEMVVDLPRLTLTDEATAALGHGQAVRWEGEAPEGDCAVFDSQQQLFAIGRVRGGRLHPRKVLPRAA